VPREDWLQETLDLESTRLFEPVLDSSPAELKKKISAGNNYCKRGRRAKLE
jgi:hypothetical protein